MNELTPRKMGAMSTVFSRLPRDQSLGAGIRSGFPILSFKGKVWTVRQGGVDNILYREDGDPLQSIELVIVRASDHLSKFYYSKGYDPNSVEPPDCFSSTGVTPDSAVAKPFAKICASCPKNAWGSGASAAAPKAKACADAKRLAVVPIGDLGDETGPMLLRVPGGSLKDLKAYDDKARKLGYEYYAIVTRIGFDATKEFPKLMFSAVRALTDAEAEIVVELFEDERTMRILEADAVADAQAEQEVVAEEQPTRDSFFEQPPAATPARAGRATQAIVEAAEAKAAAKPRGRPKAEPTPPPVTLVHDADAEDEGEGVGLSELDDELDRLLDHR